MHVLAQADSVFGFWAMIGLMGLNLTMGVGGAIIIGQKDHGGFQIAWHLIFGLFCCGPWSLVSALVAEDLSAKNRGRVWRDASISASRPYRTPPPPQQVRCPQCGNMNAAELVACWHCAFDLAGVAAPKDLGLPSFAEVAEEPDNPVLQEMRIACRACGKRFAGRKGKIQLLKACPKCNAQPFDYRQLPAAE